jgi:ketosteroid isomerase-like protein
VYVKCEKEPVMPIVRDTAAITQTFTDYIHTFQTLDPQATLSYCHTPCMFISPQGVRVMATQVEAAALFTQVMEGLKARRYARSELTDLHVHQMSENTAFVSVGRVRYATAGEELERLGETYTFRKTEAGWKIVVAMIHDPDTVLRSA